jgi:hypothetical protein
MLEKAFDEAPVDTSVTLGGGKGKKETGMDTLVLPTLRRRCQSRITITIFFLNEYFQESNFANSRSGSLQHVDQIHNNKTNSERNNDISSTRQLEPKKIDQQLHSRENDDHSTHQQLLHLLFHTICANNDVQKE